jgi:FAD:protein FMN transferase
MGTRWRVRAALRQPEQAAALATEIATRLDEIVAELSHWDESSNLCRYNRAAAGSWVALAPHFATVIACALEVASASGGAFDPALGALVDLWGFGPHGACPAPTESEVDVALACSGVDRLRYDRFARRLYQPGGLKLDLSGIGKGYAVDMIASLLAEHGCQNALVEIGGECVGRGLRPDSEPWWVDLEPPEPATEGLRVALHELAVATSGDYVRGRHTIDPSTGYPSDPHLVAVNVLHPSAMRADAWASALTVLGPDRGAALATERAIPARIVVRTGAGHREWLSPALKAML